MSAYDVDFMVLEILLDGLDNEISVRMSKCDKIDIGGIVVILCQVLL